MKPQHDLHRRSVSADISGRARAAGRVMAVESNGHVTAYDAVPDDLKEIPQWVVWRYQKKADGKPTKVPYRANVSPSERVKASSTDPDTWATFNQAVRFHTSCRWTDGIGLVVGPDDDLVGVDLDGVIVDSEVEPWARDVVKRLDCYTEVSPSGAGLRIFVRGSLPPGGREKDFTDREHHGVGFYEWGRLLTVTGQVVRARGVVNRTAELAAVHREVFGEPVTNGVAHHARPPLEISDAELLARARAATNGAAFWSLWNGDVSGYGSRSEADSALIMHLLWWTGGNPAHADALFRQSALIRPKWDERRGDLTYGQRTTDRALAMMTGFYEPFTSTAKPIRLYRPGEEPAEENEVYPDTDMGNGARLVARYGHVLRYCHIWSKWLAWDGSRWRVDDSGAVMRCAKTTARGIFREAAEAKTQDMAKKLGKHAVRSQADARLMAMIHQAESEVPVSPDHLDADPWLINVRNGCLSLLERPEMHEHTKDDLLTKMAGTTFEAGAQCPTWLGFLDRIMGGNQHLIRFLQRAVGYSLTGMTTERVIFFPYGSGANGKSTFLNTIATLLDDYALRTPTDTLMVKREAGIPNDLARLRGARFVYASETEDGKRLAEALIKDLTGGDTISARFMRGEWFDFKPTFKLWIATNHKPVIRGTDNAIWERIKLIPFTVTIPEGERDKQLGAKLLAELPGILAWSVRGCEEWQRDGLGTPEEVRSATAQYRAEMDVLAAFLQDECVIDPQATVSAKTLYEAYKKWCDETGEHALAQRRVGVALAERGFGHVRKEGGWTWVGLRLRGIGEPAGATERASTPQILNDSQSRLNDPEPFSGIARSENQLLGITGKIGSGSFIVQPDRSAAVDDTCRLCGSRLMTDGELEAHLCNRCWGGTSA